MSIISKAQEVPYSTFDMYNLVDDIEKYAVFLPWCDQSIVHYRDEDEVKASIVVAAGGLKKSFTTHNFLQHSKMIEIRLIDGPFKHLEGFWRFEEINAKQSKILFDLEYEFSNKLLDLALGPFFSQATNTLVDAFCKRAELLYGTKNN